MKIIAILVHGFNVVNPELTINKLRPYFENLDILVETFNYGYVPLVWQIRQRNPALAKRLAGRVTHWKNRGYRVIVCGHSNGCAITHIAARDHGTVIDVAQFVNPALDEHLDPAPNAGKIFIYHNREDQPVRASEWLSWMARWVPGWYDARPWGQMGATGYRGSEAQGRIENVDTLATAPAAGGHSGVFHGDPALFWLPYIAHDGYFAAVEQVMDGRYKKRG